MCMFLKHDILNLKLRARTIIVKYQFILRSHLHTNLHEKASLREQVIKSNEKKGIKDQRLMQSKGGRLSDFMKQLK